MSTARPVPRDRQIADIRRISSRPAPAVGVLTPELPCVRRRHDPTVALLLVSSVVFLVVGVATVSIVAWLAGVVSLVAALSVDTRHERELRDFRRSREPNHAAGRPSQLGAEVHHRAPFAASGSG